MSQHLLLSELPPETFLQLSTHHVCGDVERIWGKWWPCSSWRRQRLWTTVCRLLVVGQLLLPPILPSNWSPRWRSRLSNLPDSCSTLAAVMSWVCIASLETYGYSVWRRGVNSLKDASIWCVFAATLPRCIVNNVLSDPVKKRTNLRMQQWGWVQAAPRFQSREAFYWVQEMALY